jgi:hypothetical protein
MYMAIQKAKGPGDGLGNILLEKAQVLQDCLGEIGLCWIRYRHFPCIFEALEGVRPRARRAVFWELDLASERRSDWNAAHIWPDSWYCEGMRKAPEKEGLSLEHLLWMRIVDRIRNAGKRGVRLAYSPQDRRHVIQLISTNSF